MPKLSQSRSLDLAWAAARASLSKYFSLFIYQDFHQSCFLFFMNYLSISSFVHLFVQTEKVRPAQTAPRTFESNRRGVDEVEAELRTRRKEISLSKASPPTLHHHHQCRKTTFFSFLTTQIAQRPAINFKGDRSLII